MVCRAIDEYLTENGIKYTFVAGKIGVSDSIFSMMMKGKRKISADEFVAICRVLGVTADTFTTPAHNN